MNKRKIRKSLLFLGLIFLAWTAIIALIIYNYSKEYYESESDVGIVLGAGASEGHLSPVFKERVNHSIYLYQSGSIKNIIFTGGFGKNQSVSDSRAAANYALQQGVPNEHIFIEEKSTITYTNLKNAKVIMDKRRFQSALIISDPLHMKRSILLSKGLNIKCNPSPTKTSMYKSKINKFKFLIYETFYFNINLICSHFNLINCS